MDLFFGDYLLCSLLSCSSLESKVRRSGNLLCKIKWDKRFINIILMFGLRARVDKSLGSKCSKGWIQIKAHILKNPTDNEGKWKATSASSRITKRSHDI